MPKSKTSQSQAKADPSRPTLLQQSPIEAQPLNPSLGYELKLVPTHPYFNERGLTWETIAKFGLGYCQTGPLARRIAIPIHNARGDLTGYAGRWPGQPPERCSKYKFLNRHWRNTEVFNLHRVLDTPVDWPLIIVQGFFDVMKLWQLGCRRAVAIMGSELCSDQLNRILWHRPASPLIIIFDETESGRWGRDIALASISQHTFVRRFELSEGLRPEDLTARDVEYICSERKESK